MSSSTSSFRTELKVLAMVLLALLAAEGYARFRDSRLKPGSDIAMLRSLPQRAKETWAMTGPRVVLMGNSLTRNGYDLDVLNRLMAGSAIPAPRLVQAALHGSILIEWGYILQHELLEEGQKPDVLVMNLSPGLAADETDPSKRIPWLVEETRWGDVRGLMAEHLLDFESRMEFLHSSASVFFARRGDLRYGMQAMLVPEYEGQISRLHQMSRAAGDRHAARVGIRAQTYHNFVELVDQVQKSGVRVLVVAMPVMTGHNIEPELAATIERTGAKFLDCRVVPGLEGKHFEGDGWHLNPDGAVVFSTYMAQRLPPAVAEMMAGEANR